MALTQVAPSKTATKTPPRKEDLKPEKVKRVDFTRSAEAKSILDDKSRLTAAPGRLFDTKKHLAPKKNDFSSEFAYMTFRADQLEASASDFASRAAKIRQEAEAAKNAPDPVVRAQVKRVQRLKDQLQALQEQLAKEGITI